jgi:EAL domain-containing protein (putative c-di-GMP-specific phosphodiesterase class I)
MDQTNKNEEIVRTIVMLGHNLGMDIIAEGIETEKHKQALQALECEYGQGNFFSKPLPSESVFELLQQNAHDNDQQR